MTHQNEAERLATLLDTHRSMTDDRGSPLGAERRRAAALLRSQAAEIERLKVDNAELEQHRAGQAGLAAKFKASNERKDALLQAIDADLKAVADNHGNWNNGMWSASIARKHRANIKTELGE